MKAVVKLDMRVGKHVGMNTQSIVKIGPTGRKEGRLDITESKDKQQVHA